VKKDPFTGADEEVYFETAVLSTHLRPKQGTPEGETTVKLQLEYQGCSDKLCFRLTRKEIAISVTLGRMPSSTAEPFFQDPLTVLKKKGLLVALLLTFLAGLGSAFTPCVLPIIPITLAFIGVRKQGTTIGRNFVLSLF